MNVLEGCSPNLQKNQKEGMLYRFYTDQLAICYNSDILKDENEDDGCRIQTLSTRTMYIR